MKKYLVLFYIIGLFFNTEIIACSIVSVKSGDDVFIGRNFDWDEDGGEICFFKGSSLYAHFTIHQFGKSMPYEGINECGLFVGQTAISSTRADASFSFLKKSTTSLGIMKKVLERAKNIDEAINIFEEYNIWFGKFLGFPMIHYLVADKNGDSAVIEHVDGKLTVIRKEQKNYQLLTNFLLSEFSPDEALKQKLFYRYRLAVPILEDSEHCNALYVDKVMQLISQPKSILPGIKLIFDEDKKYSFEDIQKTYLINQATSPGIMKPFNKNESYSSEEIGYLLNDFFRENDISPSHTIWSSIYLVTDGKITIQIYYERDWENPNVFDFTEEIKNMKGQTDCRSLELLFGNDDF